MKKNPSTILFATLLALGAAALLYGQSASGGVSGTVTDPAGAAIPGAAVVLRNTATNIETTAGTNASGLFTFVNVQPGPYRLTVRTTGFKSAQVPEFTVDVNQTVTQNMTLSIGAVTETVTVESQAEMIQPSSAELGSVIPQKAVQDLPLNGRNFTQLLTLTPGATPVTTSQATIGNNDGNTVALPQSGFSNPSIHGQWNRSSVYFLDGIINTDFRTTTYTILPEIDLIQEFKVQSHNDKAEYGGAAGGIINVVSKSGTNELHGSAFEFVRNDFFNARDTLAEAKRNGPFPFRQNQFGATATGPIIKNRMFFSGGYNGWRYTKPVGTLLRVPTAQEIAGDFSKSIIARDLYDPATDPRTPFPGNVIPGSRISPMVQGFIKTYFAPPNYADPVFNAIASKPQVNNDNGWQVKVDYQINNANSAWFRYSAMNASQITPTNDVQGNSFVMNAKNFGGGIIHIFSPALILDVRGGYATRPFTITAYHDMPLAAAT
ncbi:MAG TPA: carboxypeptidase regulatory-like domain-containing protein, partial [Candidatus Solibacter sp.]|nr:carboxypeptidase regulatory-like domain-containing protein [Candidatus Solibacter sp.]